MAPQTCIPWAEAWERAGGDVGLAAEPSLLIPVLTPVLSLAPAQGTLLSPPQVPLHPPDQEGPGTGAAALQRQERGAARVPPAAV